MNAYMAEAIKEARIAASEDDVPIGAVIVKDDKIIARSHNRRNVENNALLHAEIMAIDQSCKILNSRVLSECDI